MAGMKSRRKPIPTKKGIKRRKKARLDVKEKKIEGRHRV